MKATINGITYEGTLDEIKAIMEHVRPRAIKMQPYDHPAWLVGNTKPSNACTYPCNCTGACTSPRGMQSIGKSLDIIDKYRKLLDNGFSTQELSPQ